LVKHSRTYISNSIRELSKVADGATEAHFKALLRTVKYVIDTEHLGLLFQPKLNEDCFYLEGIYDSEYAGDTDTCISVYGCVLYFCGPPLAWKSKAVKSVTLSATETEYYATLQKKYLLQRTYWRKLVSKLCFQSSSSVILLVPST
jgi:hypothetical protein